MAFMSFWKTDSTKLTLGPGLDLDTWDSIFGAGSYDAVQERGAKVISVQKAYVVNAVFRRCIEIRKDALASLPWGIYEEGVEAGDYKAALYNEGMAAPPSELAVLRPLKRWLGRTEQSLAPTGRAYHLILRKAVGDTDHKMGRFDGLQYMNPHTVKPIIKAGGIAGYKRQLDSRQITLDVDAVFAIFEDDPYVEVGPGSSDGMSATMNATSLYEVSKFLNTHLSTGLKKMTVLTKTTDARFTPDQKSELQRDWKAFMARGTDRGAPPILNGVIPTVIGEGLKELNDSKLNEDQAKFIAMGFGIPWAKYDNTANRSTSEVHERGFLTDTVIPQSDVIAAAFNEVLFPDYGLALRFEPERANVFTSLELEKAESVEKLWTSGLINKNEGRLWIGQPDLGPDGEVFFSGAVSTSPSAADVPESDGRSPDREPVQKHMGPGNHPSGSPQSVHGNRGGSRSIKPRTPSFILQFIDRNSDTHLDIAALRAELRESGDWFLLEDVPVDGLDTGSVIPLGDEDLTRPIVLNGGGDIIDGRHRVALAQSRGIRTLPGYVPYSQEEIRMLFAEFREPVEKRIKARVAEILGA